MKIGDLEVKVVRKNIKNLYIRVYPPDGQVSIACPQKLDEAIVREFVDSKIDWIRKKQAKFQAQTISPPRQFISGEYCYFKGDLLLLKVIYHQRTPKVVLDSGQLNLYVRYGSIIEQREQVLNHWYRQRIKAELPTLINKWEQVVGVKINDWGVKKMKTRWGTCNTYAKRIWVNLELIKYPPQCLEYVVVHELVHLLERKHNARFWSYMSKFMPQWQIYQSELQRLNLK